MTNTPRREAGRIDALFVQSSSAFSSDDHEITLLGLAEATVYFADRPRREAGHMPSRRFLELWGDEAATFVAEPPHAVLSFLDEPAEALADVVVVLHEPRLDGDQLTYRVEVLNGTLPPTGGPCSLFIDTFGRSLAPVSVRGLRRPRRTGASQAAVS
jgi:hypothetical protein